MALAPIHETSQLENQRFVRQGTPGQLQLAPGAIVVEETAIKMFGEGKVSFARIRPQSLRGFDRGIGKCEPGRRVVGSVEVNLIMHAREFAIGLEVVRIPRHRLLEEIAPRTDSGFPGR